MDDQKTLMPPRYRAGVPTLRYCIYVVFRRSRLIVSAFLGILTGVALYVLPQPPTFEAEMKLLFNRGRVDSVVSSDSALAPRPLMSISLDEINTELQLLRSRDLLRSVVLKCRLHEQQGTSANSPSLLGSFLHQTPPSQEELIAAAVSKLDSQLETEPMRQSTLMRLAYRSADPEESARVLNTLAAMYLEKHTEMHRPRGAYEFFRDQAEQYRQGLRRLEARLSAIASDPEAASPQLLKEATLQRMVQFEADHELNRASIAVAEERIQALEKLSTSVPARTVTQIRTSSKALEDLRTKLLELQLKRTELMRLFQPGYPELQIIENQIAQTQQAIESHEKAPPTEEVTDRDPTHDWIRSELMKARAELSGLRARADSVGFVLAEYGKKTQKLTQMEIASEELMRQVNLAKENYLNYAKKQEDARISDELDRHRILNVAIAEAATAPFAPNGPGKAKLMFLAAALAAAMSVGLAFFVDSRDPTLRSVEEVQACLNVPVTAVLSGGLLALPAPRQEEGSSQPPGRS